LNVLVLAQELLVSFFVGVGRPPFSGIEKITAAPKFLANVIVLSLQETGLNLEVFLGRHSREART
jgi:hypothetical protein